jgi:hypothetical protein
MCCVRWRSSTRDRANHSNRQTAPSGFSRSALRTIWYSMGDRPAARAPGAHNCLTVGRHLISNIHDGESELVTPGPVPVFIDGCAVCAHGGAAMAVESGARGDSWLGWNVARSFDCEMSRGGSGARCRRRQRGAPCSAASRPRSAPPCMWLRRPGPASRGATWPLPTEGRRSISPPIGAGATRPRPRRECATSGMPRPDWSAST